MICLNLHQFGRIYLQLSKDCPKGNRKNSNKSLVISHNLYSRGKLHFFIAVSSAG